MVKPITAIKIAVSLFLCVFFSSLKIDPFAYLEEKIKRGEKVVVRCCGGGEKKEAPAYCESGENKADSGCCGAKKEGSGCGDKTESGSCAGQKCC